MKKYAILTSVLALTACAGGSGGGNPQVGNEITPRSVIVSDSVKESNKEVVGSLASQILVAKDGVSPTIVRSATVNHEGKEYTLYDLNDVEFKTTSLKMNTGIDDGAIVTFITDKNGQIDKIHMIAENETKDTKLEALAIRDDKDEEGNSFIAIEGGYVSPEGSESSVDAIVGYHSINKKNEIGLRYSDVGVIAWGDRNTTDLDTSNYFAGGYTVQKVNPQEIDTNVTFKGTAEAVVRVGSLGEHEPTFTEGKNQLTLDDANATLVFNKETKQSTLTTNFGDNWYAVKATMDKNGKLDTLQFDKTGKTIDNKFAWNASPDENGVIKAHNKTEDIQEGDHVRTFVHDGFVQYYHDTDSNAPKESVMAIRYADSNGGPNNGQGGAENMRFDMGFGGKAQ